MKQIYVIILLLAFLTVPLAYAAYKLGVWFLQWESEEDARRVQARRARADAEAAVGTPAA